MSRMDIEQAVSLTKQEWDTDPELKKNRDEVLEKFGEIFKLENIDNLTAEQLQKFLRYSKNHHWGNIHRPGGFLIRDMPTLKKGLKMLLDESRPISERIKNIREKDTGYTTKYLGVAIYTPILFIAYPEKYPVINEPVAEALNELGLYDIKKWENEEQWISIPEMQEIVRSIAKKYDLDFWQVDLLWWKIAKDENSIVEGVKDQLLEYLKKTPMNANFKPIVIKTLLEKGSEENFTATLDEIKENLTLLNFERKDFEINQAIKSVSDALKKFVTFDNNVSPVNLDIFATTDVSKCLKVCGQKIAQWHIDEITKSEYEMWNIKPGSRDEDFMYLDEFFKTNSIGVGWDKVRDISNLSEPEIKQKFDEQYDEGWTPFQNFMKIKPKDIVVLTKGQEEVCDFGIVVSNYEFKDTKNPSYPHRKNIVWLNRGQIRPEELPNPNLHGMVGACGKIVQRKQEFVDVLLENQNLTSSGNYFIITSYTGSKYDDKEGEQYHFPSYIKKAKEFVEGTNFIVQTKIDKKNYFVGYGRVGKIEEFDDTNEKGKPIKMRVAKFSQYTKFEEPKERTDEINDKMLWIAFPNKGKGSPPPSMLKIEPSFYREIMGENLGKDMGRKEMDDNISEIIDLLNWKKNVILYGPPGTGKTHTCEQIQEFYENSKTETERKIALCFPSNGGIEKIEQHQKDISDDGYLYWGISDIKKIEKKDLPITGYICEKQKIIAKAIITDIIKTENSNDEEIKSFNRHKVVLKIENIILYEPSFDDKKLLKWEDQSIIDTRNMSNFTYVEELDDKLTHSKKVKLVTFHPSYSYEDFIEGIRPVVLESNPSGKNQNDPENNISDKIAYELQNGIFKIICDAAEKDPKSKYLLIIDEVNRGNIPKIFGELITLVEDDKRQKLSINLAYSKKSFTVPENLYILGTMNTADKSLIEIDAALRRRFAFYELMPKPKLKQLDTKVGAVHLGDLLIGLNKKIRDKDLRDKQIGHSYFMGKDGVKITQEDLQRIFKYNIIPLLYDYFYGDFELLEHVLGGKLVSKKKMIINYDKIQHWDTFEAELIKIIGEKQEAEKDEESQSEIPETSEE